MTSLRVPEYEQQLPTSAPLPGVRDSRHLSPDDFGMGIARSLESPKQATFDIVVQTKRKMDDARIMDAYDKVVRLKNDLLAKATQTKGENALNIAATVTPQFVSGMEKVRSALTPEQQTMAHRLFLTLGTSFDHEVNRHVMQQSEAVFVEKNDAAVNSSMDDGARTAVSGGDDKAILDALAPGRLAVLAAADHNGLSGNVHDDGTPAGQQYKKFMSIAHINIMSAMIKQSEKNPALIAKAQKYLEDHRDEISTKLLDQSNLEDTIHGTAMKRAAQSTVDSLWMEMAGDRNTPPDIAGMEARINKLDPQMRPFALEALKDRAGLEKGLRSLNDDEPMGMLSSQMYTSGKNPKLNPAVYNALSWDGRGVLDRNWDAYQRSLKTSTREQKSLQAQINANLVKTFELLDLPEQQNLKIRGDTRFGDADESGYLTLEVMQKKAKRDNGPDLAAFTTMVQVEADKRHMPKMMADSYLLNMKAERIGYLDTHPGEGTKIPTEEARRMLDESFTKVITDDGWLWDTTMAQWQAKAKGLPIVRAADAPKPPAAPAPAAARTVKYRRTIDGETRVWYEDSKTWEKP